MRRALRSILPFTLISLLSACSAWTVPDNPYIEESMGNKTLHRPMYFLVPAYDRLGGKGPAFKYEGLSGGDLLNPSEMFSWRNFPRQDYILAPEQLPVGHRITPIKYISRGFYNVHHRIVGFVESTVNHETYAFEYPPPRGQPYYVEVQQAGRTSYEVWFTSGSLPWDPEYAVDRRIVYKVLPKCQGCKPYTVNVEGERFKTMRKDFIREISAEEYDERFGT